MDITTSGMDKTDMRGVIFDMDGLMFDTEAIYAEGWKELAGEKGYSLPADFFLKMCGRTIPGQEELIAEMFPLLDPVLTVKRCNERVIERVSKEVPVKKGLYGLLKYLSEKGYKLAVASGTKLPLIIKYLKMTDTYSYFDAVVSASEVERGKPAPDIVYKAAEKMDLDASECYFIEDGMNGVKAGYAAGSRSVMVPDLIKPDEDIKKYCFAIYNDLEEVETAFRNGKL